MKTLNLLLYVIAFMLLCITNVISYNLGSIDAKLEEEIIQRHIENGNVIKFIWNDDEESIPMPGALVKIEDIDKNTVYLTPIN